MHIQRRHFLSGAAGAFAVAPTLSFAQTTPLARLFCGFPAGGTADTTTRRLAEAWRGKLADNVIVENRVGAGGRVAINALKEAAPDGATVLLSPDSMMSIYPSVYRKLSYNPAVDVTPVSSITRFTFALGVGPGAPASIKTLADFIAWAKANPGSVAYGSPAAGSMPHFLADQFFRAIGVPARHAPYRGSAPALQDLVGGHIPSVLTTVGDFLPFLSGGALRMLATADAQRTRFMPDVPTFGEQGFAQVRGVETYGLFLPGKAPPALVARIGGLVREAAEQKALIDAFALAGMETAAVAPADYQGYIASETTKWAPIVAASGFTSDD